jgi:hypothetical protein
MPRIFPNESLQGISLFNQHCQRQGKPYLLSKYSEIYFHRVKQDEIDLGENTCVPIAES